eukprot:TRINITY_DN4324_c0_g15_i1.p1 TRINITY_DN4324_c0_g15~~TRINITY_DN4324_c0_g15_i1.p1  ORF type:complete len:271 (+),score=52.58 TRINITY_DN4324_c0_g15_i1:71-883(+)
MSRRIALVASGSATLQNFGASVLGKATGNAVSLAPGAVDASAVGIAIAQTPADAHTVVTRGNAGANAALYKDVKTLFVRAVLPAPADSLALRDLVDVYASSGIKAEAEVATVKASFAKTADLAVSLAKANGNKITVFVKQASKHEQLNTLFKDAIESASSANGVAVEYLSSAHAANALIMAPETLGVVAAADTPSAENAEQAFSGLLGGVSRTFYTDAGKVAGAHSHNSVAHAVAESLRSLGLTAEAKKIDAALAKAKGNDNGSSLLAAI